MRALIKHAYENTQYYYELMQDLNLTPANIKTIDDLHILPILTKEAFRDNFRKGKIIAQNINKGEMILYSSIGSTGKPLQYFITKNAYSYSRACGVREWYWIGYRLGDKYIKISLVDRPLTKQIQDKFNRSIYLTAKQLNKQNFYKIVQKINTNNPKIIRGNPDQMNFLAKYIKKDKIDIFSPQSISTTG